MIRTILGDRFSPREVFIGGLLLASVLLVAILTWQAVDSTRSHRATAESALHDYSAFAAREFVRRAESRLGYSLYDIAGSFRALENGVVPEPADLAEGKTERVAEAVRLVQTVFLVTLDGVETAGEPIDQSALEFLDQEFLPLVGSRLDDTTRYSDAFFRFIDGRRRIFVYYPPEDSPPTSIRGFEIDPDQLEKILRSILEDESLLPVSLGTSQIGNDGIMIRLSDRGRTIFSSHPDRDIDHGLTIKLHDEFSGLFEGADLQCGIHPDAAPRLLAGGIPPSRLPFLVTLMLLTFGLLTTAIILHRREAELSRLRTDFISSVSHELRTPLTQIRMFSETLRLKRVRSVDEEERALEIIDQEARRLGHLVENILQFSRAERGALRLDLSPLALGDVVPAMVESFTPLAVSAGVDIALEIRSKSSVYADRDAVQQILINFLDNAIKYGPKGQRVIVRVTEHDGFVSLSVEDEGPGIPPGHRSKIWDRFRRLTNDQSATAGAGIGLAVVRELASLQGGAVNVSSGENGGSRFSVEFPAMPGSGQDPHLRESEAF